MQAAASEYDQKVFLSLSVCSFSREHGRAPKTNNWPYKLKQILLQYLITDILAYVCYASNGIWMIQSNINIYKHKYIYTYTL